MYVKLNVGAANINPQRAMRDIMRLLTSTAPNVANLEAFSSASSVVIDQTPAGWTYVGSNQATDYLTIAAPGAAVNTITQTVTSIPNMVCSAPCLSGSALKYAALTLTGYPNSNNAYNGANTQQWNISLTGASGVTGNGVMVNEGARPIHTYAVTTPTSYDVKSNGCFAAANSGVTLHLIANARHITIIEEGRGIHGVWEASTTGAHTFYGSAPMIQFTHANTAYVSTNTTIHIAPYQTYDASSQTWAPWNLESYSIIGFNLTNPNNASFNGTYDLTLGGVRNSGTLVQNLGANTRTNTISSSGSPQYQVGSAFFAADAIGYPLQFVSGIVPIYFTAPNMGNTGDTVNVNGTYYTYFNSGFGFGVLMTTGN